VSGGFSSSSITSVTFSWIFSNGGNGPQISPSTVSTYIPGGGVYVVRLNGAGSGNAHIAICWVTSSYWPGVSSIVSTLANVNSVDNYSDMWSINASNYFVWNAHAIPNTTWMVSGSAFRIG